MKKLLIPLVVIFALTVTANAQDKMGKRGHHGKHQKGMLAKELNLTEDQKKNAKAINDDFRTKMQDLNKKENITVKEMREQKSALLKERKSQMNSLLTAEQKAKMANLKAERKLKHEDRSAKHLDKMKTTLNLSDEQVTKLKAQRSAMKAKAEKIKMDQSLSIEQKKEKMTALRAEAKEENKKIFTPEQMKKREEMKKNHSGRSKVK